jgi:hypothetical protein
VPDSPPLAISYRSIESQLPLDPPLLQEQSLFTGASRRLEAPPHRRSSATSTSRRPSGEPLPTKPCPMGSPFVEGDRSEDHLMDPLLMSAWQPCHHGRL